MLKRRAKQKSIELDYAQLIKELNHWGYTCLDISQIIDCDKTQVSNIKNDLALPPRGWIQAAKLIDLYLMVKNGD